MGNMIGTVYRNGKEIEVGYGVPTICGKPGCTEKIDRGLDYLCGSEHGGDEYSCGDYFCGQHLYLAPEGHHGNRCILCRDRGADPTEDSPDAMVVIYNTPTAAPCSRCKGTAIDPEHSTADGIDGPAYLEPCIACQH